MHSRSGRLVPSWSHKFQGMCGEDFSDQEDAIDFPRREVIQFSTYPNRDTLPHRIVLATR